MGQTSRTDLEIADRTLSNDGVQTTASETAEKSVIVYDGACALCRRAVEAIRQRDPNQQFVYFARQTPGLDEKYPAVAIGNFDTGMRFIEPDGTMHIGACLLYTSPSPRDS